ncbi:MAG: hypothetical protein K2X27_25915, partial [Candidatus Obscuribacterales bacterium]|nr:hypothetical protein [Candidatus Obscuribacterales bacterium]
MSKTVWQITSLICFTSLFLLQPSGVSAADHSRSADAQALAVEKDKDGNIRPEILVGPIDLHRKYRSMEGPYVIQKLKVADLVASKRVQLPGGMIVYLDPNKTAPSMAGAMASTATPGPGDRVKKDPLLDDGKSPIGLADSSDKERELYWFKGIKLVVLDENDKPMPTAEFICHMNLDVDQVARFASFPDLERTGNLRIMTLTQGQTEFNFPDGYAVPVASDETWTFTFQAANRTTDEHRRLKHLCTLTFVKDSDLKKPLKALHWFNPYIAVQVGSPEEIPEHKGPSCMIHSSAGNAPNMVPDTNFKGPSGKILTGHWSVPPGRHTYRIPVTTEIDFDLAKEDRTIHAVWTHIHPCCVNTTLSACKDGETVFSVDSSTKFKGTGPELKKIDNILSREGIKLRGGESYELKATYDNPSKETLDSMVALGVFCESKKFQKPDWAKIDASASAAASASKTKSVPESPSAASTGSSASAA